jgi:DNA-binding GntR family transcriptional regulator
VSVPSAERVSLGEAAYRQLRADIVSCRLAPGARLTERSLAESTGFGISSIRDALTRLDHDGLVRTLPRKGYQVAPLTLKSVDDLFALWGIVGPEIARLGVRDADPELRRQAIDAFTELTEIQRSPRSGGRDFALRLVDLAAEAFMILATATDNDYLIGIYQRLQSDMARVWALISEADAAMPDLAAGEEWADILTSRDGNRAAAHVEAYILESHRRILRILSRWPSVVASEIVAIRA